MRVIDFGHSYALDCLSAIPDDISDLQNPLVFVKRVGENYPGNEEPSYPGTTTQEVIRALIDRTKYVDGQKPHSTNDDVLFSLRCALLALEYRAAEMRKDYKFAVLSGYNTEPELHPTCPVCGHILCHRHKTE